MIKEPEGYLLTTMYVDEEGSTHTMFERLRFTGEVSAAIAINAKSMTVLNYHIYEIGREIKL